MSFVGRQRALAQLSVDELHERRKAIERNPANLNPAHLAGRSIWIYTKRAQQKLNDISWAITYKLREARQ